MGGFARNNYLRKGDWAKQVPNDLRFRVVSDLPIEETGDFDESYFMGFAMISGIGLARDNLN